MAFGYCEPFVPFDPLAYLQKFPVMLSDPLNHPRDSSLGKGLAILVWGAKCNMSCFQIAWQQLPLRKRACYIYTTQKHLKHSLSLQFNYAVTH